MAFDCKVQYLDDTDPFNSTSFPEPSRPPVFSFRDGVPICTQLPGIHRLLNAPHNVRDFVNISSFLTMTCLGVFKELEFAFILLFEMFGEEIEIRERAREEISCPIFFL